MNFAMRDQVAMYQEDGGDWAGTGSQPPRLNDPTFAKHNADLGGKLLLESNALLY